MPWGGLDRQGIVSCPPPPWGDENIQMVVKLRDSTDGNKLIVVHALLLGFQIKSYCLDTPPA